jgi:hypothetical protein
MIEATSVAHTADQSVDPADEGFHAVHGDASWSESYYFYYFDPAQGVGGYTRLGFRPNDGWKDAVHILYLPGSRLGFGYDRKPHVAGADDLTVSGTSLHCDAPFRRWRIELEGSCQDCPDGRILVTPRKERPDGWCRESPARLSLEYDCFGTPYYSGHGEHGHFEQAGRVRGTLAVGGSEFTLDGYGLRDKSWGPRPWTDQSAGQRVGPRDSLGEGRGWRVFSCWLTSVIDEELAFAISAAQTSDGGIRTQGFVSRSGVNHQITGMKIENAYEGDTLFHAQNRFEASFEDGSTLSGRGEILNPGPTKIAMPSGATIVNAAMTRFELASGEVGFGISEYWSSVRR